MIGFALTVVYKRMRWLICSMLLIIQPLFAAPIGPTDSSGFNIPYLVETGIKAMPGCIGFCVTGACTHVRVSGFSIQVIVSPLIQHNMPEWVVQSYRSNGQQPWQEWREIFSKPIGSAANSLSNLMGLPDLSGLGSFQDELRNSYDQHMPFKETEIHGHPLNILSWAIQNGAANGGPPSSFNAAFHNSPATDCSQTPKTDANGQTTGSTNTCDYTQATMAGSGMLTHGFPTSFHTPALNAVFNYRQLQQSTLAAVNNNPAVGQLLQSMAGLSNYGNNQLCPTTSWPFVPYYLSEMDFFAWRMPEPELVSHGVDITLDSTEGLVPGTRMDARIGGSGITWGWLYPRVGFASHSHDGKVASITTIRVQDLLLAKEGQDQGLHNFLLYPSVGFPSDKDYRDIPYEYHAGGIDGGTWQPIWPNASYSCRASLFSPLSLTQVVNDDSAPRNLSKGRYAWAFWRRYECCMNRRGRLVFTVRFPTPLCVTLPALPDPSTAEEL